MNKITYVECKKCGSIHYLVDEETAEKIKLVPKEEDFGERNMECCYFCGEKGKFSSVSAGHVNELLSGNKIQPVFLKK